MSNLNHPGDVTNRIREFVLRFSYVITFLISFLISGLYFSMTGGGSTPVALDVPAQPVPVTPQSEIIYMPDYHGTPCFTVSCIGAPGPAN